MRFQKPKRPQKRTQIPSVGKRIDLPARRIEIPQTRNSMPQRVESFSKTRETVPTALKDFGISTKEYHHILFKLGFKFSTYTGLRKTGTPHQTTMQILEYAAKNGKRLTICMYYPKARIGMNEKDPNAWIEIPPKAKQFLESKPQIASKDIILSHGVSPQAYERLVKPQLDEMKRQMEKK